MNPITVIVGVALLLLGTYITTLRYLRPEKLNKLAALKELFGDKTGNLIHLVTYSIIPFVSGSLFVFAGFKGVSLF